MKTKSFFQISRVLTVVFSMAMCLTILSSCDEASTAVETKSAPITPTPEPEKVDTVDYTYNPQDGSNKVINDDYTVINGQEIAAGGFAQLELAEHVVKLFGEDLPSLDNAAAVANAASELKRTTRISGRDTVFVTTLSTSIANNKNVATTTSETVRPVRYIDGKYIAGAYLVTDQIICTNINIVGRNTRSEWVLENEFDVAVGVDVVRHEAGLTHRAGRTNLVQHLADTFKVERYIKNDIISWRVKDSVRIATTYVDEYEKYTIEYTKRDNEKFNGDIMLPMNYFVKPTALPEAIVNNFNFNLFNKGNVVWENNEALVKTTETTKVYERHGSYASDFSNGVESFNTLYNTMNQRTVYNDGLVSLSTGYAEMAVAEKESSVANVQSDRDGHIKGIFTNNIEATYLNMAQPVQENKVLYMVKPAVDEIISKGWDKSSKNKWFKADSVICEANWVIKHTLKEDEVFHYRMAIPRFRKPMTDWRAVVKQFIQTTAEAQKPQTSSNAESKTTNDGLAVWRWQRVEGSCSAYTTADQATEENSIYFLEANSISVTREGETLDFGEDEWSFSHNYGKLGNEQTVANGTEVPFTLTWNYKFGNDNSRIIVTPGTLFKEKAQDVVTGDWDYSSKKKNITPTSIEVEVKWVEKHTLGNDVVTSYKRSYPRSASVGPAWQAYVAEFTQTTDARSLNKTTANETANDNGAVWSAVKESYAIKANTNLSGIGVLPQANTLNTVEYNSITLTREGKVVEFGVDAVSANHDGGSLGSTYKVGNDEACDYTLGWNYGFGSSNQNFTSNGKLMKKTTIVPEEEDKVLSAGWENAQEVMTDNGYTLDIDWVVKHSKKADEVTHYQLPLSRNAKCTTNWSATVSRLHQSTGASTAKKTSSSNQSKADGAATWNWVAETYSIVTKTSLTGASAQANEIVANENNSVSITREGKTYSWKKKGIAAPHDNGHLKKVNDKQYSYELIVKYNFGTNVKEISCPGTLNLK